MREFITAETIRFIRFFEVESISSRDPNIGDESIKEGKFMVREKEVRNILHDPEALRVHLGLKRPPIFFCEVSVPENTRMRVGIIGPQSNFGRDYKGGFQYQLLTRIDEDFYGRSIPILSNKDKFNPNIK